MSDPLAFHQPTRLYAVRDRAGRWLRANKTGRPQLAWSLDACVSIYVTDNPTEAEEVAGWVRLREETAYMTEIVPDHPLAS